jgi:hypothetical protein
MPALRSILRPQTPAQKMAEENARALQRRREQEIAAYVERIKAGEDLIKYDASRQPVRRRMAVSDDGTTLLTGPRGSKNLHPKCELADIIGMYNGPFSQRFKFFDCSIGKSWLCIVIELEHRTIDLVCEDEEQFMAWFLGLQSLVPLNATFLGKGALLWARANMMIDKRAFFQRKRPLRVWAELLLEARRSVRRREAAGSPQRAALPSPSLALKSVSVLKK